MAQAMVKSHGAIILDVREPWETERVSIDGSYAIPLGEVPEECKRFAKDLIILTLCHHGVRSQRAAMMLRQMGLAAWSIKGGIDRWSSEVDPALQRY